LTASVSTPELVLTASRPAISLPSVVPATSTAAGEADATSEASSSAVGATTYPEKSAESATYTFSAPYSPSRAAPDSDPGPVHTTDGDPSRRAAVSSSRVTFLTSPSAVCSARTSTSAMETSPP
jgi:hypothetical protein